MRKLYGLDLFTGIGGITLALDQWVKPVCYCEIDEYCQKVIQARIRDGNLPGAAIWDDIQTLNKKEFGKAGIPFPEIITGGFPCQDISNAGSRVGLEGERSRLFFQIMRLTNEFRPRFLFLENVSAIITLGIGTVLSEISKLGYNARYGIIPASAVGARHRRSRWWLFAYPESIRLDVDRVKKRISRKTNKIKPCKSLDIFSNANRQNNGRVHSQYRMFNDVPNGVDRIKALGNAVVPAQAKFAFDILTGLI